MGRMRLINFELDGTIDICEIFSDLFLKISLREISLYPLNSGVVNCSLNGDCDNCIFSDISYRSLNIIRMNISNNKKEKSND